MKSKRNKNASVGKKKKGLKTNTNEQIRLWDWKHEPKNQNNK